MASDCSVVRYEPFIGQCFSFKQLQVFEVLWIVIVAKLRQVSIKGFMKFMFWWKVFIKHKNLWQNLVSWFNIGWIKPCLYCAFLVFFCFSAFCSAHFVSKVVQLREIFLLLMMMMTNCYLFWDLLYDCWLMIRIYVDIFSFVV